jgi:hypothetical protein
MLQVTKVIIQHMYKLKKMGQNITRVSAMKLFLLFTLYK